MLPPDDRPPEEGGPVDPGVIDQMVIVYGPDGTMYPSPGAARAAGVTDYTMTPPGGGFRLPGFGDISGPPSELLPPGAGGTGNIPEIGIGRGPGGPGEIVPPMVPPEGGGFRGLPPGLGRDLRIPRPMPGSLIGGPSRDRFGMPIDQGPIRIPPQRGPEDPIMRTVEPIMRPMPMPRPGILPEIPRPDVGGGGRVSTMPVRLPMPRFPR
jgi:hypothetical protein